MTLAEVLETATLLAPEPTAPVEPTAGLSIVPARPGRLERK